MLNNVSRKTKYNLLQEMIENYFGIYLMLFYFFFFFCISNKYFE